MRVNKVALLEAAKVWELTNFLGADLVIRPCPSQMGDAEKSIF